MYRYLALLVFMFLLGPGCDLASRVVGDPVVPGDGGVMADSMLLDGPLPDSTPDMTLVPDAMPPATSPCMPESQTSPNGVRKLIYSKMKLGGLQLALEPGTKFVDLTLSGMSPRTAAAVMDRSQAGVRTAGFAVTHDETFSSVGQIRDEVTSLVQAAFPLKVRAEVRTTGSQITSHDHFPLVVNTIIDLDLKAPATIPDVRDALLRGLLGPSKPDQFKNLPPHWGPTASTFSITFSTLLGYRRAVDSKTGKPQLDSQGVALRDPAYTGPSWRVVVGAVALRDEYQNLSRRTGLVANDLAGGTALALSTAQVDDIICEAFQGRDPAKADIIWVVDESGSMKDNRDDIVRNAANFFDRAVDSGIDFRVGVTNVVNPLGSYKSALGKFCSRASADSRDSGGDDRFLLPTERTTFEACVRNPPGYEGSKEFGMINARQAVTTHLPRLANSTGRIRPGASLVVIIATDEIAATLIPVLGSSNKQCTLSNQVTSALGKALLPQHAYFAGILDPEAKTVLHVIGGVCNNSCRAHVTHGYSLLAQALGGQVADVCQKDLGPTMQSIIDHIAGKGSLTRLAHVPIAASLAVALDGKVVKRSREKGFDYRPTANTIVFLKTSFRKGSRAVVGYRRWK